jgi:hypothetical protein
MSKRLPSFQGEKDELSIMHDFHFPDAGLPPNASDQKGPSFSSSQRCLLFLYVRISELIGVGAQI